MNALACSLQKNELATFFEGTSRSRLPEETLALIDKCRMRFGITRLADVTKLDRIGIPVWQAIRPMSRNLSVSQGKGLSAAAAKVSALMEGFEMAAAEQPRSVMRRRAIELPSTINYSLDLLCGRGAPLVRDLSLEWSQAYDVLRELDTFVPTDFAKLDFTRGSLGFHFFRQNSTGLASGNCYLEAVCHGFLEICERDALAADELSPSLRLELDPLAGPDAVMDLASRVGAASLRLRLFLLRSRVGVPVVRATIDGDSLPPFGGSGASTDISIAATRAISEAAQSRLTFISGARDDIELSAYEDRRRLQLKPGVEPSYCPWPDRTPPCSSLKDNFDAISALFSRVKWQMLVVDLTPPDCDFKVVRCVTPEAALPVRHG